MVSSVSHTGLSLPVRQPRKHFHQSGEGRGRHLSTENPPASVWWKVEGQGDVRNHHVAAREAVFM